MSRLFTQHKTRSVESLDGAWTFYFPREGTQLDVGDWQSGQKEVFDVPCVWEMSDRYKIYRGQAVARKIITIHQPCHLRLVFKGVSHTATVYLDGKKAGGHHNAFTPFTLDAGKVSAGEHELLVHITNEYGDLSALHIPNDYYNYGGISRPVEMQMITDEVLIRHLHVVTKPQAGGWLACCRAEVINLGETGRHLTLRATLAGQTSSVDFASSAGTSTVQWEMTFANVKAWSSEEPNLYMIQADLLESGSVIDDLFDRIGFRCVEVAGEDLLMNGQKIFPMGFNRHEDHALYGCAIPVEVMRSDLRQMVEMNANAVRTCHYPNDERFLDLCDEMGIYVWEENHARGIKLDGMKHPRFREQCAACNEEMVREHFNHPCIFVWGIMNECESALPEGAAMYREQFEQLHELDNSRPLTFASCRQTNDICQEMPDIAGWNMYPGWYNNIPAIEKMNELIARFEPLGMKDKPLIFSEFGAGALPGCHDPVRRERWSEERQCDILDDQLQAVLSHPRVTGAFIWQFCDVRVDSDVSWAMRRPRLMNNKGVVDEYRRPKLSCETVKKHFGRKRDSGKRP